MSKIFLLPILVFLDFQIIFWGAYFSAIAQGHVVPQHPYISDGKSYSPENCIFGQFINIGSVLWGVVIYLRYRYVIEMYPKLGNKQWQTKKLNSVSLWVGIGACLGVSVIANFHETEVRPVFFFGECLSFSLSTIYFCIHAIISFNILPYAGSRLKAYMRAVLSIVCVILFIVGFVTGVIAFTRFRGNAVKWLPSDGGWKLHIISTVSEWIALTIFTVYVLSFASEFRHIHFLQPPLKVTYTLIHREAIIRNSVVHPEEMQSGEIML